MGELEAWLVSGLNEVSIIALLGMAICTLVFLVLNLLLAVGAIDCRWPVVAYVGVAGIGAVLFAGTMVVVPDEIEYREIREAAAAEAAMATPTCECRKGQSYE